MAAYLWDIVSDSLVPQQSSPFPPSFLTTGLQNTHTRPTPLENQIKDIVISAYSNNKTPLSPQNSPQTTPQNQTTMMTTHTQPVIYSAEDMANSPTSPLFPTTIKPTPAGPALSTAQGEPNVPISLRGGHNLPTNLSDIDKQLMFSPHDPPLINSIHSTGLSNAFSIPSVVNDKDEEGSVCSEPINGRQSRSLATPTPSLPGNITLQMPAHLRTSRPLILSSSTHPSPSPSSPLSTSSTPTGEETSHVENYTSHDHTYNWSHDPVVHSFPINAQGGVSHLRDQLRQLLTEKAHLEGQLESVIEECQATLTERAQLQSKLAQTEVELTSLKQVNTPLQRKQKSVHPSSRGGGGEEEDEYGTDLQGEINRLESTLSLKRRELVDKNKQIETEKQKVKQLTDILDSIQKLSDERQKQIHEGQLTSANLEATIQERDDTIEELKRQLSSLKATLDSNETSKTWLREQLQNTIDSKTKLHEEMRSLRATALGQSIKMDTLAKEKDLFQEQIQVLQKGILQDKAKLVSELEAIEEDVLSKEGSYVQVLAEKEQLEKEIELKTNQLDTLTASLADVKALNVELSTQLSDSGLSKESLLDQIKSLTDERNQLGDQVRLYGQQLTIKEQENKELKRSKTNLHQRLQQAETSLVTSEGSLQGIKDSTEVLQHELESLEELKKGIEKELNTIQAENARLETELDVSENKQEELERELAGEKRKYTQAEKRVTDLELELSQKRDELVEKDKTLDGLQNQSDELRNHFRSLKEQFENIASQSESGLQEKDETISRLIREGKEKEKQVHELVEREQELKTQIDALKELNARLEGELETALNSGPQLEDFKRVLKEKNDLDGKLVSERLAHQQELIKTQAKVARLDTELKDTRKESKKREGGLQKELESAKGIINELKAQLEEMKNTTVSAEPNRDEVDGLQGALQERDAVIESLKQDQLLSQDENTQLKEQLREEREHTKQVEEKLKENIRKSQEDSALDKERHESEKHQLSVELQHLKGRLAGINRSQQCTREHANSLEKTLAQKETQLQQLSTENDRILAQKEDHISELQCALNELRDGEANLKSELEKALNDGLLNKQRGDEMERQVEEVRVELNELKRNTLTGNSVKELEEQIDMLEQVKTDLQSEVRALKQQVSVSQSATQMVERELQDKTQVISLLEQNLKLTKDQLEETQSELEALQFHLNQKHYSPHRPHPSSSTPHFTDGSLSPVVVKTTGDSVVDELPGRGGGEGEKSREISDLRSQLGSKSMTVKNLQSCLRDLKNDMGYIQTKMDHHSYSLQSSYKSSQKLESKIKTLQLSRSSSGGEGGAIH